MKELAENLTHTISLYFHHLKTGAVDHWWILPVALIAVVGLSRLWLTIRQPVTPVSAEQHIFRWLTCSGWIVGSLLILIFVYLWADTDYYQQHQNQLLHLIILVVVLLTPILCLFVWRGLFVPAFPNRVHQQPITQKEQTNYQISVKNRFQRSKWCSLILVWGFLPVLLTFYQPNNLVSIVIDNSSSMEDEIAWGKIALGNTIRELDSHTHLIISWLNNNTPPNVPKENAKTILDESDPAALEGYNTFFDDHKKAIDHLQQLSAIGGTPLLETTWSNFRFAAAQQNDFPYAQKILLIISDGEDSYVKDPDEAVTQFFCNQEKFAEFYDQVAWINLGGELGDSFHTQMQSCGYYIEEDGTNEDSYRDAVNYLLGSFKRDWYFIIWLGLITLSMTLVGALIQPKRI